MSSSGIFFMILSVGLPILIVEPLLFLCWRTFGDRGAYPWYSVLLRTLAYSPCMVVELQGLATLPLGSALFLNLRGAGMQIMWLYGLPEIFVGLVCIFIAFGVRLIGTPSR